MAELGKINLLQGMGHDFIGVIRMNRSGFCVNYNGFILADWLSAEQNLCDGHFERDAGFVFRRRQVF